MKKQISLEVKLSVVRQTDGAIFPLSCRNERSVSYNLVIVVWGNVFFFFTGQSVCGF